MTKFGECPHCRASVKIQRFVGEEVWTRPNLGPILGVDRIFTGFCSVHGKVMLRVKGHHTTISETAIKDQFDKADREKIKQLLSSVEAKKFSNAVNGHWLPEKEIIHNWHMLLTAETG
jgi:hypothetical protein